MCERVGRQRPRARGDRPRDPRTSGAGSPTVRTRSSRSWSVARRSRRPRRRPRPSATTLRDDRRAGRARPRATSWPPPRRSSRRGEAERPPRSPTIDPETLELYEELRPQKKGVGAAALVDDVCQGCHEQLSAVELDRSSGTPTASCAASTAGGSWSCDRPARRVIVNCDGAARGNPGPAGAGAIVVERGRRRARRGRRRARGDHEQRRGVHRGDPRARGGRTIWAPARCCSGPTASCSSTSSPAATG